MKKILVPLAVIMLLALATPAFAEWELGLSWTPTSQGTVNGASSGLDSILGFHVGYAFLGIGYASWDAFALPNFMVWNLTGLYYVPGFLNMWDAGLRLVIGPVLGFATLGVNNLYVYQVGLMGLDGIGANIRLGLGAKFGWWGVTLSGMNVYSSFGRAASTIGGLFSGSEAVRAQSWQDVTGGLLWSIGLTFYLG